MLPKMLAFDKADCQDIYDRLVEMKKRPDAHQVLIDMQTETGLSAEQAEKNLEMCVDAIAKCESVCRKVNEDAVGVVNAFLASLYKREDRMLYLHKLYFGLCNDQLNVDLAPCEWERQFADYYEQYKDAKTPEELEKDILRAVQEHQFPANQLRSMAEEMESVNAELVLPSLIGQDDLFIKSIMTMKLYLDHPGELSMYEAANVACCSTDALSTADKLGRCLITRETAKKITYMISVAIILIGAIIALASSGGGGEVVAEAAGAAFETSQLATPALPEIFAGFALDVPAAPVSAPLAESGGIAFFQDETLFGKLISLGGALIMALSVKIGDLVGRIQMGRLCSNEMAQKGFRGMSDGDDAWLLEEKPLYHWEPVPQTQEEQRTQQIAAYLK